MSGNKDYTPPVMIGAEQVMIALHLPAHGGFSLTKTWKAQQDQDRLQQIVEMPDRQLMGACVGEG